MLGRVAQAGCDQQRAKLVTVQRGGMRFVVQAGPPDVRGRGMVKQFFFYGVLIEPSDSAQAARDSRPRPAAGFQVAGEAFDVGAAPGTGAGDAAGTRDAYWRRSSAYASRVRLV